MSNSLLRASLDLINLEIHVKDKKSKKNYKNKSKSIAHLIPANHRIIKKDKKSESTILHHSRKITVHEAKKQLEGKKNTIEENVQKLLLLSRSTIDPKFANKYFKRGVTKRPLRKDKEDKEAEKTAFTEEDFKNFEKEYLGD